MLEILGNPLIGVVGRCLVELHPIIGVVFEPAAQEILGQPAPPTNMQDRSQIKRIDSYNDRRGRDHPKYCKLPPELGPVVLLKRIVEIVVPRIEPDIEPYRAQTERDDRG